MGHDPLMRLGQRHLSEAPLVAFLSIRQRKRAMRPEGIRKGLPGWDMRIWTVDHMVNGAPRVVQCTTYVAVYGVPVDRQRRRGLSILGSADNVRKDPDVLI